jgi:hypothetical protein
MHKELMNDIHGEFTSKLNFWRNGLKVEAWNLRELLWKSDLTTLISCY